MITPDRKKLASVTISGLFLLLLSGITSGRNAIIFVADGLRQGSVNEEDAPAMSLVRKRGVFFVNSHSLFPTFTTPNASALATGHFLGDTGDFSNTVYTGYPLPMLGETQTPFIENDRVLGSIDEHFGGNFLHEETLLSFAAADGYNTAAIGKLGPTLIQDAAEAKPVNGFVPVPKTIIIDDSTGKAGGVPLDPQLCRLSPMRIFRRSRPTVRTGRRRPPNKTTASLEIIPLRARLPPTQFSSNTSRTC